MTPPSPPSIPTSAYLEAERPVDLVHDNMALAPTETARLLGCLCASQDVRTDEYLEGGAIEELESRIAARLRKESALYVPSGTLANHLALTALTREGDRIVVDSTSHIARDAGDGLARWNGRALIRLDDERAGFDHTALAQALREAETGKVPTRIGAIALESPMRRRDGEAITPSRLRSVITLARQNSIPIHLDCARAFIACAWTGVDPADLVEHTDTAFVSLWKCFNAPSGAVVVGDRATIDAMRPVRRAMGGSPRSAWIDATIAMHFLEQSTEPFELARKEGDRLIELLESNHALNVERVTNGTHALRIGSACNGHDQTPPRLLKINPTLIGADMEHAVHVAQRVFGG